MSNLNLILHCGASKSEFSQVAEVATPEPTKSWHPIPHTCLIDLMEKYLPNYGLTITNSAHGLTRDGARYFGLFQVESLDPQFQNSDFGLVFGLRNSHDKTFPAGLCLGNGVFVCDNLSFSAEIVIGRRHTKYIMQDLPRLMGAAVGKLMDARVAQVTRLQSYKETEISDETAAHLLMKALESKAINTTRVPKVWEQWKTPNHQEFAEDKNVWRLFNGFTEVLKDSSLTELPNRTTRLHGLLDSECGIVEALNVKDRIADEIGEMADATIR